MLEVLLSAMILASCTLAMLYASLTSGRATRETGEYSSAVAAARKKMEELCATPYNQLVMRYGRYNPTVGNTFPVYLNEGPQYVDSTSGAKMTGQQLPGLYKLVNGVANYDAGEIIIITNESAAASTYGYSCGVSSTDNRPDLGQPGGCGFKGIPIDLNGDGNTTSGTCYDLSVTPPITTAVRLPVGIIVRWNGPLGPERYELWTVISNF